MQNKIKLSLVFLVLIALFSVFSFFSSFGKKALSSLTSNLGDSLSFRMEEDADHDGLTNQEESYWNTDFQNPDTDGDGFLDGEEVASGHDPLKPGPDDLLDKSKNITASLSELIVGGLYNMDLSPQKDTTKYSQNINSLSLSVIEDFNSIQPTFSKPELKLIGNSRKEQESYLDNIAQIIKQNILTHPFGSDYKTNPDKYADQYATTLLVLKYSFMKTYQELLLLPVPKEWRDIHYSLMDIVNRLSVNYGFVGTYQSDPYKAMLALNEIQNLDDGIKQLLAQINSRISQDNLKPNDDFYKLFNQLNTQ